MLLCCYCQFACFFSSSSLFLQPCRYFFRLLYTVIFYEAFQIDTEWRGSHTKMGEKKNQELPVIVGTKRRHIGMYVHAMPCEKFPRQEYGIEFFSIYKSIMCEIQYISRMQNIRSRKTANKKQRIIIDGSTKDNANEGGKR